MKKQYYDIIYITNLPAFYKINLLNRIAENCKVLVIFTHETSSQRNNDFYSGNRNFEYISVARHKTIGKIITIFKIIYPLKYNRLILGGWDQIVFWVLALLCKRQKNSIVVESSIHESKVNGIKGFMKRIFLTRMSRAYPSGKSNTDLIISLGFNGEIIKTRGVGIFNIVQQPAFIPSQRITNFLYVGRLSVEKNLEFLIETFNEFPYLNLNIIGFGPLENLLKSIAKKNIHFYGAIPNIELSQIYKKNEVFILASIAEPWGLVVEEALNNGLPVIVSNHVGCATELVNESNGIIFDLDKPESLKEAISKMLDVEFYNFLKENINKLDFEKIAEEQVNCYTKSL